MEEREIDLIDLMVEILYRWKGMVLAALVGAALLGGLREDGTCGQSVW